MSTAKPMRHGFGSVPIRDVQLDVMTGPADTWRHLMLETVSMRSFCCALLVAGLITLAGCATGGDGLPRRTGLLIEPGQARNLGYVANWSTNLDVPSADRLVGVKVLGDLLIAVEYPGNLVTAVSVRDGSIRWRTAVDGSSTRLYAPARHGDHILVNSDTRLYLLAANDGDVEQVQPLGRVVALGPTVVGSMAVFGSVDGTIFAHDVEAGFSEWEYALTNEITTPPVARDNEILVGDSSGIYVMLDQDGQAQWRGRTFGAISAAPALDQSAAYIASEDRSLYALNRGDGNDRWPAPYRTTQPLTVGPKSYDLTILQPLPGRGVLALDAVDGTVQWEMDQVALPVTRSGDHAIMATPRSLMRVDLESGDLVAESETLQLGAVLEGPEGSLILVSPRGRLLRINPVQ